MRLGVVALALSSGDAIASPFTVTTTGVVTSGSDPANLIGAGSGLVGSTYTLSVAYAGLGSGYFTDGSGQFAIDSGDTIPGAIRLTIGGTTLTTILSANTATTLIQDSSDLSASNAGNDAAGNFAYVLQNLSAFSQVIPFADLQSGFSYRLTGLDTGVDSYSFSNAANIATASFSGTESSISFAVPEPATWSILGLGLLGLAIVRRRRAAWMLGGCVLSVGTVGDRRAGRGGHAGVQPSDLRRGRRRRDG